MNSKGSEYGWNVIDKNHRKKPVDFSQIATKDNSREAKDEMNSKQKRAAKNKKKPTKIKQTSQNLENYSNYQPSTYGYDKKYYGYEYDNYYHKGNYYEKSYSDYSRGYIKQHIGYSKTNNYKGYNDHRNYYKYDNNDYYSSYYNYYDNYYYNQGYNNNKQGTKSFKRKMRPNKGYKNKYVYGDKYNSNLNNQNENAYYYDYSVKYKDIDNNNNYKVIIKDLDEDENIIRTNFVIQPKDQTESGYHIMKTIPANLDNNTLNNDDAKIKEEIINKHDDYEDNSVINMPNESIRENESEILDTVEDKKVKNNNIDANIDARNTNDSLNPPIRNKENLLHDIETNNQIEEINVNKVHIENLRSYFDKFKHFTIFNETMQPSTNTNTISEKKSNKPFNDQFSNFKASTAMLKSIMNSHHNVTNSIFGKESERDLQENITINSSENTKSTVPRCIKSNTQTINEKNKFEITSTNSNKIEPQIEDKKIYNFSLFISGIEKSNKVEEHSSNNGLSQENKNKIPNQPITQPITQQITQSPNIQPGQIPNNYMYYPNYSNMPKTQQIGPYMPYEMPGYMNMPYRMSFPDSGNYGPEFIANNTNEPYYPYEYPQYQYYGMPYRFNNIQYPGYQNFQYGGYPSGHMGNIHLFNNS